MIEQIVEVPPNGKLTINLPSEFINKKRVKVTIDDTDELLENKIALLKKAARDANFLGDLEAVSNDFQFVDRLEE